LGEQQDLTPESFDYIYNYIVHNNNRLPPRQYQDRNPQHHGPKYPDENKNQHSTSTTTSGTYYKKITTITKPKYASKPYWAKDQKKRLRGEAPVDADVDDVDKVETEVGGAAIANDSGNPWDDHGI